VARGAGLVARGAGFVARGAGFVARGDGFEVVRGCEVGSGAVVRATTDSVVVALIECAPRVTVPVTV